MTKFQDLNRAYERATERNQRLEAELREVLDAAIKVFGLAETYPDRTVTQPTGGILYTNGHQRVQTHTYAVSGRDEFKSDLIAAAASVKGSAALKKITEKKPAPERRSSQEPS